MQSGVGDKCPVDGEHHPVYWPREVDLGIYVGGWYCDECHASVPEPERDYEPWWV